MDEIVACVLKNIKRNSLCEDDGLVGASSQVNNLEKLLENGSDEVQTIGI